MASVQRSGTLEFKNVFKAYGTGTPPAVRDISFTVQDGHLVTLVGPSGCGKTTTLRMIAGLEQPTAGQILLGGKDVTHLSAADRNVSMVFQSYALFPHMNVVENVAYGLAAKGCRKEEIAARVDVALRTVGLSGFENRLPSELSGGQQQRVAIARAVILEPSVLLFDEPLSNLDARLRRRVREEIRELQQRLQITVVYVTHDREEALAVSDEIIVMNTGVIAEEGAPMSLFFKPRSAFVADFLAESNLLDAAIEMCSPRTIGVDLAGQKIDLPRPPHIVSGEEPIKLAVRPESMRFGKSHQADMVNLSGVVLRSAFVGRGIDLLMETGGGEIFAFMPGMKAIQTIGESVTVHVPVTDLGIVLA